MITRIGKKLPDGNVTIESEKGSEVRRIHNLLAGKRVILFGVPGAFTNNCSSVHFPSFVEAADEFYSLGVDLIACLAVNDVAVMSSWKKTFPINKIFMISDGDASYVKSIGLDLDEGIDAGIRSKRFCMLIDDLVVNLFFTDEKGVQKTHGRTVLNSVKSL
jgi:peroxiredoxin